MADNRPHWADTAIAVFTGLMLLTYISANYFSCQQSKTMQSALEQSKKDNAATITAQKDIAQTSLTASEQISKKTLDDTIKTMKESNAINRAALVSVQRAFMFVSLGESDVAENGKDIYVRFDWENSGVTPTKKMVTHIVVVPSPDKLPDNYGFPDLWAEETPEKERVNSEYAIGPKAKTSVEIGPLKYDTIVDASLKKLHIYAWGWARYSDIFPRSLGHNPEHITQFCMEIIPTDISKVTGKSGNYRLTATNCKEHNCYDDTCKK